MQFLNATILFLLFLSHVAGVRANTPAYENTNQPILEDEKEETSSTVLVSTIDGYLRALDANTGAVRWSLQEEPVFRSPSSVKQGFTFLPNPLDGSLYVLKNSSLKKLPFNIPQLVHASPCKGNDGVLYAGSKKDVWFGIDPVTGVKVETLSSASADRICPASQKQTVFLGRTEYRVSMFDEHNRARTWNATFNDYSAHLLPESKKYHMKHYVSSSTGNILAVDGTSGEIKWEQDLRVPIAALYLLQSDGLHKLPFTVMGRETIENIVKSAYSMEQWPTVLGVTGANAAQSSLTSSFFPTLYVGESSFGLYAIDTLVDQHTITYSPKLLGPPLLEGAAPIALSSSEKEQYLPPKRPIIRDIPSITHKTMDGEFLLLGYHEPPAMSLGSIIPTRFPNFGHNTWAIPYNSDNDQRLLSGPKQLKELPYDEKEQEKSTLGAIIVQIYEQHPKQFYATIVTLAVLVVTVVWMCGRQWGASSVTISSAPSSNQNMIPGEHRSVQTSRQHNGNAWSMSRTEILDGWMNIGKVQYDPGQVLGWGCEGTIVYKGKFDGREVAVKRVVSEFVRFVEREATLLKDSDAHPHVIRYFCMEADSQFRYLALELCHTSLYDYIEKEQVRSTVHLSQVEILRQAADGLAHLHASKIVHRDMKPQNVLITMPNQRGHMRAVISDFGLCKRVQPGKNSLSRGLASGLAGTEGWIAPEALVLTSTSYPVDIFSLGCIFYYVLSEGSHPFGESLRRQINIVNGNFDLKMLTDTNDGTVSEQLVSAMLSSEPALRPLASTVLNHPFFWSAERRLAFFGDVSDRVEKEEDSSPVVRRLEQDAKVVVCGGWREKICDPLKEDLRKFRTYKSHSVRDLLRAMRNKKHHYRELPETVRQSLGHIPDQFLLYFTSRFPKLLLHAYNSLEYCSMEPVFERYYSDDVRERMNPIVEEEEKKRREQREKVESEVWERAQMKPTPEKEKREPLKLDPPKNRKR